jgi:hypothetical protein
MNGILIAIILILICCSLLMMGGDTEDTEDTQTDNTAKNKVENFDLEIESIKPGPVRAEDAVVIKTVSPHKKRIGKDTTFKIKPLVDGAFLVISHHESGCFLKSHNIYLAVRNDGSIVYNDEEFGPNTLDKDEIGRIHELMIEKDFFDRWYKVEESLASTQLTTKFYSNIYYTDGRIYATLSHIPEYITDLVRSLEVRYRLKSRAHAGAIGKFVY